MMIGGLSQTTKAREAVEGGRGRSRDKLSIAVASDSARCSSPVNRPSVRAAGPRSSRRFKSISTVRSEEHTSELQSHHDLVCRLLLEKKTDSLRTYAAFAMGL